MKAIKILLGLIVTALLVVGLVVVLGLSNLNSIVKKAVETVGPDVLGTEVLLQDVNIELTNGRGELSGLTIANPKGFSQNNAFSLGKVALQVDPSTVTGDVIVIDEVLISGAKLLAEQKNLTETNLQALLNNVQGQSSASSSGSETAQDNSKGETSGNVKLAIRKFTFEKSELNLVSEKWGDRSINLPEVNVKNIGSKDSGLTPEQLTQAMIQPILKAAEASVKKDIEKLAKEKLEAKAQDKLKEKLGEDKVNQLKSLFGR